MITEASPFGCNVWWSVPTVLVDAESARDVIQQYGFGADLLPLPTAYIAVSRAAYSFQERRRSTGRKVTEKTRERGRTVTFGILEQGRVNEEEVEFHQTTTVTLDKETGRVEVTGRLGDKVLAAVEVYRGNLTADDLRAFVRRVVDAAKGIPKKPSGGIYFVPEGYIGTIEQAQAAVAEIAEGGTVYIEGVCNGERERRNVWESVEAEISKQIEETVDASERVLKRVSALKSYEAKLGELTELMDCYRTLLGQEATYEDLAERLKDAATAVAEKISEVKTAAPPPAGHELLDDIESVLREAGKPLHVGTIADALVERGVDTNGTEPKRAVVLALTNALNAGCERIVRAKRGYYELPTA